MAQTGGWLPPGGLTIPTVAGSIVAPQGLSHHGQVLHIPDHIEQGIDSWAPGRPSEADGADGKALIGAFAGPKAAADLQFGHNDDFLITVWGLPAQAGHVATWRGVDVDLWHQ